MSAPIFIELDGQVLLAQNVAAYEALVSRSLSPAQAEYLVLQAITEAQLRTHFQIQNACTQMLVNYATAPALDELASLVGVTRLPASSALVTIRFTLVSGHGGILIPSGTRIGTTDGQAVFTVVANTEAASGLAFKDVTCACEVAGAVGNGYTSGQITVQLDPLAFVTSVSNTTTSSGGADAEGDEDLRVRTKLAPASFSVAGPRQAYQFFARTASPAITDVAVVLLSPGTVGVYPLVADGVTGAEILALVDAILSADDVRPLTDTVVVAAPTLIDYDIEVELELYEDTDSATVEAAVQTALEAYSAELRAKMGRDVIISQIIARASVAGVYKVTVVAPNADVIVAPNECANIGTVTVTVTGENEG